MRYLLKLADDDGYFEEVDQYTYDNHKCALNDSGNDQRYEFNNYVILNDDNSITVSLTASPMRDIAILQRFLNAHCPMATPQGFVREPVVVKFQKGKSLIMRELKSGKNWKETVPSPKLYKPNEAEAV